MPGVAGATGWRRRRVGSDHLPGRLGDDVGRDGLGLGLGDCGDGLGLRLRRRHGGLGLGLGRCRDGLGLGRDDLRLGRLVDDGRGRDDLREGVVGRLDRFGCNDLGRGGHDGRGRNDLGLGERPQPGPPAPPRAASGSTAASRGAARDDRCRCRCGGGRLLAFVGVELGIEVLAGPESPEHRHETAGWRLLGRCGSIGSLVFDQQSGAPRAPIFAAS